MRMVITNRGDTTMEQMLPHTCTHKHVRPDHLVVTTTTTTHQTPQITGTAPHASDVESMDTRELNAEGTEFSAHIAEAQTMISKLAGNSTATPPALQIATYQQDTTPQQHHHHS